MCSTTWRMACDICIGVVVIIGIACKYVVRVRLIANETGVRLECYFVTRKLVIVTVAIVAKITMYVI